MKNRKALILILLFFGIISLLVGVTYSFFNYTKTGLANNFSVGNVSFNTSQDGNISLSNVFPITSEELGEDVGNHDSVTINISGSTNFTNGVEYLVTFTDVNNSVNDKLVPIAFTATGTNIGTGDSDYYENRGSNSSIYTINEEGHIQPDKYILVGYIAPGTIGINGSITVTAYVDADRIAITDTPEDNTEWIAGRTVLSTEEWSSLKGNNALSFKIRVEANQGIWVEEEATPGRCFTVEKPKMGYILNSNMTEDELNYCINYFSAGWTLDSGWTYQDFCQGIGKSYGATLQEKIDDFSQNYLDDLEEANVIIRDGYETSIIDYDANCGDEVIIPKRISTEVTSYLYNSNMTNEEINNCVDYFTNTLGWSVDTSNNETMESFCDGSGTNWGYTFQETINNEYFGDNQIQDLMDFNIVLLNVETINNVKIKKVDSRYDPNYDISYGAFEEKGIKSVIIPNTIEIIGYRAFIANELREVTIPDSVQEIYQNAFSSNELTNVTLGNGVKEIGRNAFSNNNLTVISIPYSVTSLGDNVFWGNQITTLYLDAEIIGPSSPYVSGENYYNSFPYKTGLLSLTTLITGDNLSYIGRAFEYCHLTSVTIGSGATMIGYHAFANNQIETLIIGENVANIGDGAFNTNLLTTVDIPDSTSTIGDGAFSSNQLVTVTLGNGINNVRNTPFFKGENSNQNLVNITANKTCSELKAMSYYPWIGNKNRAGTTIYGSGGEVCDAY